MRRAEVYLSLTKKDSALYDLNYVLKHDSLNTEALLSRALLKMDDLKYPEALKDFNTLIQLSSDDAAAYFNRAILKSNTKDYHGALSDYEKVIELNPENILAYYNRAVLKYAHHDLPGALEDDNSVISLYPNFSDAYYNRSLVEKDLNKTEDSKKDYNKSIEITNSNNSLSDSAKVIEEAKLIKFTKLSENSESQKNSKSKIQYNDVDIQPQSIFYIDQLSGQKKIRLYKLPPKKNIKDSVITLINTPPDSINGKSIFSKINALDSAIVKDSTNASAYFNRAMLYSIMQKYDQSIDDYNKSIRIDSTNAMVWFSRANTRYKLLELLYSFDEETSFVNENNSKNNPKRVYIGQTYEMVLNDYSKALQLDPDFTYALFNKATTKIKMADYKGAIEDYSTALTCEPTLSDIYYNRGLLLIILHNSNDGCIDLSKAGELGITESYNVIKRFCYK